MDATARKIEVQIVGDSASLQRAFRNSSRGAKNFEHDIGRASRGAISAAVSFRGLGRSMAFASAQFLGGAGIVFAIKSTISAAEKSQTVLAQTSNAVKRSGLSWDTYGEQVKKAALAEANISGFDDERLLGTFSNLVRKTKDVNEALKLNALAANVARGRNISLEAAQMLVMRASLGMSGALRRVGIDAKKGATGVQLIQMLTQKYSGAAKAYGLTAAGAQDRFRVAVENLQEAVGSGLLPTITRTLNPLSTWLNNSKNQERVQRDVSQAVREASSVIKDIAGATRTASDAVGGFKEALKLLLALKVASMAIGWSSSIGLIGTSAEGSAAKVAALRSALLKLVAIGAVTVGVEVAIHRKDIQDSLSKKFGSVGKTVGASLFMYDTIWKAINGGDGAPPKMPKPHSGTGFRGADLSTPAGMTGSGAPAGLDRLSQIQNAAAAARLAVARKAPGAQAQLVAALKEQIDYDKKYAAIQQGLVARGGKDAKAHAQKLQALYADETSALDEINSMQDKALTAQERAAKKAAAAAKKAAAAAKKKREEAARLATTFTVPMALLIAQAKAGTTVTKADDISVAKKIKAFAEATIKSNKKKGQALVDAWNEIANQLQTLGGRQASQAVAVSSTMLTAGLELSRAQRKVLEARYAQASAHAGHRSAGVGVAGQTVIINVNGAKDPAATARAVADHMQRVGAHAAVQVRGPHAGRNPRVH